MLMLIMTSVLLGAALGLRFKVFVLFPVAAVALIGIEAVGFANGSGFAWLALAALAVSVGLQLGYVLGSAAIHIFALSQTRSGATIARWSHSTWSSLPRAPRSVSQ